MHIIYSGIIFFVVTGLILVALLALQRAVGRYCGREMEHWRCQQFWSIAL